MISVIITAKDAERTIRSTLISLVIALRRQDEVLVLLDGCSDRTDLAVAKVRDSRIKVFSVKESLGRSEGRNFLIQRASGDVISILDADDISLPWRFIVSRNLLKKNDAVFGTALVFGSQLRPLPLIPQLPRSINSSEMSLECLGRNPVVHSSASFRRDIVSQIGMYRDSEAEEYDLWLRMLNAGFRLHRSALPLVLYRFHKNQASQVPGFVDRGRCCPLVIEQQRLLAREFGWEREGLEAIRNKALNKVQAKSFLARLELAGLSNFMSIFKYTK